MAQCPWSQEPGAPGVFLGSLCVPTCCILALIAVGTSVGVNDPQTVSTGPIYSS